jgi:hypothetical protein
MSRSRAYSNRNQSFEIFFEKENIEQRKEKKKHTQSPHSQRSRDFRLIFFDALVLSTGSTVVVVVVVVAVVVADVFSCFRSLL